MSRSCPWLLLALLVGGCASTPRIAAPPATPPPPTIMPPAPAPLSWTDALVEAGTWSYARDAAGSTARFAMPGAAPAFQFRCEGATRLVSLIRSGSSAATMTITTSYGSRALAGAIRDGGVAAQLPARDPLLDQIAFSRARFAIEVPGLPRLILPAWAEPTRVIEDCRG